MTYDEAIEVTITRSVAKREIEKHCCSWSEFLAEVGDKSEYTGAEVLDWLGY